jgi:uncharacterized protein YprB with RNaseH-like and TPR domain
MFHNRKAEVLTMTSGDHEQRREKIRGLRAQLDALRKRTSGPPEQRAAESAIKRSLRKRSSGRPRKDEAPAPSAGPPGTPAVISYERGVPRRSQVPTQPPKPGTDRPPVVLADAVSGSETSHAQFGPAYLVAQVVDDLEDNDGFSAAFEAALAARETFLGERLELLCPDCPPTPRDIVFMDIETTGLGSAPLFLIGVMLWDERGLEVRQYLARNYAEEAAVIGFFADDCSTRRVLITFNGKSFDVPFIRNRSLVTGVPYTPDLAHFDLLHESRRVWKDVLPNCKLQTLERFVCKRIRHGDIPGDQIADAYHAYVRNEDARDIVTILKHNLLDLITLADLMIHFDTRP